MSTDESYTSAAADLPDLTGSGVLRAAGEVVLFTAVALSPWLFACDEPAFEFLLTALVGLLAALWAIHAVVTRRFVLQPDVVVVALGGLAVWSAVQLVPLPEAVVGVLSPTRLDWHRTLLPAVGETLPGEAAGAPRPTWLPLTVDPSATRTFLARVLGVLIVYAAARNWLATRDSFRRLGWLMLANGLFLAVFAVAQAATGPRNTLYWRFSLGWGQAFGPFICRNHYPDYLALCVGLAAGLFRWRRSDEGWSDGGRGLATGFGVILAVGLMLATIPFSQSRGGVLAIVGAGLAVGLLAQLARGRAGGSAGTVWLGLAAVVAVAVGFAAWLGTDAVEKRFTDVSNPQADTRLPLWRTAVRTLPGLWLTGSGGGTFQWVEPTARTGTGTNAYNYFENAHNEYLEAVVEGGLPRLGLTLLLAGGVLVTVGRGYLRRHDRSVGPALLGAFFALAVAVLHAVGDFGVHIPAVAVATAAVAGFAVAAARDSDFVPTRTRSRKGRGSRRRRSEPSVPETPPPVEARTEPDPPRHRSMRGPAAFLAAALVLVVGLVITLDARKRDRADRFKMAADAAYLDLTLPDRLAVRAGYLAARAAVRPDDPDALLDAAQGRIDQAVQATWAAGAAVAGGAGGFSAAPDRVPPAVADRYLVPALQYLRAARAANPLDAKAQARLGLYAGYFATGEPPAAHFARAKRLLPTDPDVWYASGREAFRRGDRAAAWADWRVSLALSTAHLGSVLAATADVDPAELRAKLLPDDPVVLLAVADRQHRRGAADRRPLLEAAVRAADARPTLTADQAAALATALAELGQDERALAAWQKAAELAPDRPAVRSGLAAFLESAERYEEAVDQLEALRRLQPNDPVTQQRLEAAYHGIKLKRALGE